VGTPKSEDRRRAERRHRERRRLQIDALQAELDPLRATVRENMEKIKQLEGEQKVQLVRIAQIQRELDDLKKTRST
jgi:hypothetical protein